MKNKKFTLIDFVIVLVVIAVVAVVAKVLTPTRTQPDGKVEFVVLAANVENVVAENIKSGDEVVLSYAQKNTEVIKDVTVKPAELINFDNKAGAFRKEESKKTSDVYITIETDAKITDEAIQVGDVFVRVGEFVPMSSKNFSTSGHIVEIVSEESNAGGEN